MAAFPESSFGGYLAAAEQLKGENRSVMFLGGGGIFTERDAVLRSVGFALCGGTVYIESAADPAFVVRCYEQIMTVASVPNLKVVFVSVHDGGSQGIAGAAMQMNMDFALMRAIPGMAVLAPSDWRSAHVLARVAGTSWNGFAYMRLSHSRQEALYDETESDFSIGGARMLSEGDGVTICACGVMTAQALAAGHVLAEQGIASDIIDCYSVKPFPEQTLLASVRRTGCCVAVEKHAHSGGLFGAVAECLCRGYPVPARGVAVDDRFGQSGTEEELREYYGLTRDEIVRSALQVWAIRRR
ncbi:MAG: transketolase [Synergistaceae bacterium]|jgi:transketolase|nr:transketolase [Synergistaceae bacterium]